MLKDGDRVIVIKPKYSWNGERVMAKIGQKGTVTGDQSSINPSDNVRIWIDGHGKGIWIPPHNLERI